MNNIARLQAELAARTAEVAALREGYDAMISYMHSSKFHSDPYVNVTDVVTGLRQASWNAFQAADAAYINEVGPRPEASTTGWRCPECRDSLGYASDAKADERMRLHWVATHKKETNS